MITLRRSADRGHANHGWLDTRHTFSFADYYDPEQMGFRALRVINEDRVAPRSGFGTHGHRDMEIVTYVLEGRLDHKDSGGNVGSLRRGEVQRMTAGTGVLHSELNGADEPVHFFQIWILPEARGLPPSWEQRHFPDEAKRGRLLRIAAPGAPEGALALHQAVTLYASILAPGERISHLLERGGYGWVQVARGELRVNGQRLEAGDGAAISSEPQLDLEAVAETELLLFDLS